MLSAFGMAFKTPELRKKIFFTLSIKTYLVQILIDGMNYRLLADPPAAEIFSIAEFENA